MKTKLWTLLGLPLAAALGWFGHALATGAPQQAPLTWGGTVTDPAGKPYPQAVEVNVAFFDAPAGGNQACASTPTQAEAGTGRFQVTLPAKCALAFHDKAEIWSEATVGPGKTVLPRAKVGAVPYALETDVAAIAKGVSCQGCVKTQALAMDSDLDLQGHKLTTGAGGAVLQVGTLDLGPQAGDELTTAHVKTLTGAGNADALHTHAGLGGAGGQSIKFKGVTSVTYNGGGGIANMHAQCAAQYGAARVCTPDMLQDLFPAPTPNTKAWIYRSSEADKFEGAGGNSMVDCNNYTNTLGTSYALHTDGSYSGTKCGQNVLPAACCGP